MRVADASSNAQYFRISLGPIRALHILPWPLKRLCCRSRAASTRSLTAAEGSACARFFWEYPAIPGLGHFLHTYVCDGNPVIPTFQGEPERVSISGDIEVFTRELWESLDENNKISLFVRYTDLKTGAYEQRIINKHQ